MKTHTRVAVIGGGVVGCSVLYHLTKLGWKDVVLIERSELTSGSTWHAAGGMHTLNGDPNVAKLQDYTIRLYQEIESISGQSCSVHMTGGVMLADTRERLDWLKTAHAKGRYLGLETEFISVAEAKERLPIMDERHFVGALWDPFEGHVDPSGVTNAYAKAARIGGAEIYRHTRVVEINALADGGWQVVTTEGDIEAEIVVNAGGLWAREVGRMVGLELPLLAMQHQYLVTDRMPEIESRDTELAHAIDFGAELYMRQEQRGLLIGTYEQACVPWSEETTPWDFGHELLEPDIDRIAPSLEVAFTHFPPLAEAGIKQIINGPFVFAPDGNPLVGPVRGLSNFWVACGVMAGLSQGGGVGLSLSNWIVHGDPGMNVFAMDVSRFGDFATRAYTRAKVVENYRRRFRIRFPNEELPAARPLRTTPIYPRLRERGAIFGTAYGLEHALWFARPGEAPVEEPTFRRSNAFEAVGEESRAVREGVGLIETSTFAKYEISGPEAEMWLATLLANRIPREGRLILSPMLNERGRLIGDFTLTKLGPERFLIFGSGLAEDYHMRWFESRLPASGVSLRSLRSDLVGLSVAGPRARELLSRITRADLTSEAFPFMSFAPMDVAMAPALVGRLSFTGDLGYEIWMKPDYQMHVHDALLEAGTDLGLRHFGSRALNSLRLEKSFGSFTREYTPDYTPLEAGLGRFVDLAKNDFIGRDAVLEERERGARRRLVTLVVDAHGVDVFADEPVFHDGELVGWVTSGGYAHASAKSVALAYVPAAIATEQPELEVEILGDMRPATIRDEPLLDPPGRRMRE